MNKKLKHRLVANLHVSLLLASLSFVSSCYANPDTVIIIPSLEKSVMSLSVDYETTIRLQLTTNMGTGYDWKSVKHDIKSHLIETNKKKVTGNPEIREFQIPRHKTMTEYVFVYKRVWEKQSEDEKQFKLIIKPME